MAGFVGPLEAMPCKASSKKPAGRASPESERQNILVSYRVLSSLSPSSLPFGMSQAWPPAGKEPFEMAGDGNDHEANVFTVPRLQKTDFLTLSS